MTKVEVRGKDVAESVGPGCRCACDWDLQFNAFFEAQIIGNACGCACQVMSSEMLLLSAFWQPY